MVIMPVVKMPNGKNAGGKNANTLLCIGCGPTLPVTQLSQAFHTSALAIFENTLEPEMVQRYET